MTITYSSSRLLATFVSLVFLTACATKTPTLHANLSTPEMDARLAEHFSPGMTRGEVESTLDFLKQRSDRRIWSDTPPAMLARVYEPGGFWVTEQHDYLELYDLVFRFDDSITLESWTAKPFTLRYDYGDPYIWEGGPPRGWPLEPLPPREWRPAPPQPQ